MAVFTRVTAILITAMATMIVVMIILIGPTGLTVQIGRPAPKDRLIFPLDPVDLQGDLQGVWDGLRVVDKSIINDTFRW